jgi:hypothetical protein
MMQTQSRITVVVVVILLALFAGLFTASHNLIGIIGLLGVILCGALVILLVRSIQQTGDRQVVGRSTSGSTEAPRRTKRALRNLGGGGISILLIPFMLVVLRDVFSVGRNIALPLTALLTTCMTVALAFYSEWMYRRQH